MIAHMNRFFLSNEFNETKMYELQWMVVSFFVWFLITCNQSNGFLNEFLAFITFYKVQCTAQYSVLDSIRDFFGFFIEFSTREKISQIQMGFVGFEGNLSIENEPKNCWFCQW